MRSATTVLLALAGLFLMSNSCKKPHGSLTGGGKGGNGTISVTPEHAGSFIDSCRVYIKYATLDAPINGQYDDSLPAPLPYDDTTPVAVFHHLKAGIYYVYCIGYHPSYSQPNVKGGVPFTLSIEDSENIKAPTYSYNP